jgi:hypothetical protein
VSGGGVSETAIKQRDREEDGRGKHAAKFEDDCNWAIPSSVEREDVERERS